MDKIIEELEEYASLEGTEVGELCDLLLDTYRMMPYIRTATFEKALRAEIKSHLKNFKKHAVIDTKTEETTHTWKELNWRFN